MKPGKKKPGFFVMILSEICYSTLAMNHKHSNRLINETSPYLQQHAHNPVDWYAWGEEALQKAAKENKPILVSIGYSACHWCHVMERESFEDEATATLMNEHFVNIKIDREERPDLDHIYMDAVQAMTGSGGWPLNVFLTPEKKPFYGGTYFPPVRAFNRSSWKETLIAVSDAFRLKRHEIDAQAENLTEHLLNSNAFGLQKQNADINIFSKEKVDEIFQNIMKSADKEWGGFGKAPKFPQTYTIQFLLRYAHYQKNEEALKQALLSLDKMIEGGIYDHIGGGFARYSTDTEWLVPHFEKMLYDNALLISVLSEAYQLTKNEKYRIVIDETLEFIKNEMTHPQGGFYSALDADSEGVEGKFYIWGKNEINELLGTDAALFCEYYRVTDKGNFEHKNILHTREDANAFAKRKNFTSAEFNAFLIKSKKTLLAERNKRIPPGMDDKIILGWNALMNTAYSKAFAATGNENYRQAAIRNMDFIQGEFSSENEIEFFHTWKNNKAKYSAFLDDYAYLIEALINLQEITGDTKWLVQAKQLSEFVIDNFSEDETGYFFYTPLSNLDVIIRKKEVYDGATPSGNSVMAFNLSRLGLYFDKNEWKDHSTKITGLLSNAVYRYPTSFGCWANLVLEGFGGTNEIAIAGENFDKTLLEILKEYIPNKVIMSFQGGNSSFALLDGKTASEPPFIYLCRNYSCKQPVQTAAAIVELLLKA
jgi:uncharacterized protein YyaL (SSP411 family)